MLFSLESKNKSVRLLKCPIKIIELKMEEIASEFLINSIVMRKLSFLIFFFRLVNHISMTIRGLHKYGNILSLL